MGKPGATEVKFQRNQRLAGCMILDNDGYLVQDRCMNIPGKIFFGDELRWTAVISLPIKRVDGCMVMDCRKVPSYVAEFFNNLPILTGLGVREDCRLTEEIVTC